MKIIASVLAASLICSAAAIVPQTGGFSVSAYADVCTKVVHGSLTYNEYSDHAEVLQCNTSAAGAIDIPSKIDNLPVTTIKVMPLMNVQALLQ